MSFVTSNATTVDVNARPPAVSTRGRSMPATTCALVTTSPRLTTQPEPSTPRPQAIPVTRTTLFDARTTSGSFASPFSGGATIAGGPRNTPIGSTRSSSSSSRSGGNVSLISERIVERWTERRSSVSPGTYSSTAPIAQHRKTPATSPSTRPAKRSRMRIPGITPMLARRTPASIAARPRISVPRSTAHARETTGTYGDPSVRISGASRAPRYAPTAKPASEKAPRRNPVEIPYSPAIPTTTMTTQSAVDTWSEATCRSLRSLQPGYTSATTGA